MRKSLDAQPGFDNKRVLLGLWHPCPSCAIVHLADRAAFVEPAKRILPDCGIIRASGRCWR